MISNANSSKLVGSSLDRVDGPMKVAGRATYAYEVSNVSNPAHGFILGAIIGKGRIASIDTSAAEQAPGVLHVMTHRNAPAQPEFGPPKAESPFLRPRPYLASDRVRYYDQPVALIVAETFESARAAAGLVQVAYEAEDAAFSFEAGLDGAYDPKTINTGAPADSLHGDAEAAYAAAPVTFDASYDFAFQSHNPMEPHATLAAWDGDVLTLYTSTQWLANIRGAVCATLRLPLEKVRVVSPFIGGGFGAKLIPHAETILAALAAVKLGRPVKLAVTRQQMFANCGHRPAMRHHLKLGADESGKLVSLTHNVHESTSRFEEFAEQTAMFQRSFYACANRATRHRLVAMDMRRGEWMRAPGEAPGLLSMETALDELAEKLGLDPIELRLRNEPEQDPERKVPFSTRNYVACMREGAERFGWSRRNPKPLGRREGRQLIGIGMAGAIRPNYIGPGEARVRMDAQGQVAVELDMTDIGTGTYTVLTQVTADALSVPAAWVRVRLGDTRFPKTSGSGGSWGAASSATAVMRACEALKRKIVGAALADARSPFHGANSADASFENGALRIGEKRLPLPELAAIIAPDGLAAEGAVARGPEYRNFSQHSFGAHFAEVAVDADTGEIRLRRMLGVFAAGRILNPKLARSQVIGGMIWGVSAALLEETVLDPRFGNIVNNDLAGYHFCCNADVGDIDAVFLDEHDDKANPFGAKGIGELGICGAAPAVANAVYNATGARIRSFPITVDKVMKALPAARI